jgi:UDP-N-acetylmuramate--alanine ligase
MQLFTQDDPRPIHFMGIAGAGMSAMALLARRRGVAVTGCDIEPEAAADLAGVGADIHTGHESSHVVGVRAMVYTAAVPADHAELAAARKAGVPVFRRAEALHHAIAHGTVVAIGGTHGKTTTTVMTTEALAAVGRDPTGLAGGRVETWGGNARLGGDALFVVEADEYDRAFLELRPDVAVVNNVEADHLECYGSLAELEVAFESFAGHATRVLVGADDAGARRVGAGVDRPVWHVGLAADADVRVTDVRQEPTGTSGTVALPSGASVRLRLPVPGLHNLRNAAMALGVVAALEADVGSAAAALSKFRGVGRRFELVGEERGIIIVDDYAHHPTEVAATLAAARQRFPEARLLAVFQPHMYSRTQAHGEALGIALSIADLAIVTEIYPARESPIPGVTGKRVLEAANRAGAETIWVPERQQLAARLEQIAERGDVVLTLGAGDITRTGAELLTRLAGRAA